MKARTRLCPDRVEAPEGADLAGDPAEVDLAEATEVASEADTEEAMVEALAAPVGSTDRPQDITDLIFTEAFGREDITAMATATAGAAWAV